MTASDKNNRSFSILDPSLSHDPNLSNSDPKDQTFFDHHRSKSASETEREEARVIFNKTVDGCGRKGYRKVGALFLTWRDDDMQCRDTEVDKLRQLFEEGFKFKTEYFEIPSKRWETALQKKLADFCFDYDSPEDLAIIHYGGHAYEGKETSNSTPFSAKPTTSGQTSSTFKVPTFGVGASSTNFMSQFGKAAEKSAAEDKKKRKAADFDSDEVGLASWERRDAEEQLLKKQKLEEEIKGKAAKLVDGNWAIIADNEKPNTRANQELKLAAKHENDYGDPTAFFKEILTCLQLPACDRLLILDCCYPAKVFKHEHISMRKFELMTWAAHNVISPGPKLPHSFTRTINDVMARLLKDRPNGFSTSHLYAEVYHTVPLDKPYTPLLFDQARHNFGNIWLRPQEQHTPPKSEEDRKYLKLTLKLNAKPEVAMMNELALQLQYLSHVDQVRFEDLYAPRKQITDFMSSVVQAQKLRPLLRKMRQRRQLRQVAVLKSTDHVAEAPPSLLKLHLTQTNQPAYDWSSAIRDDNHRGSEISRDETKKSMTWPPSEGKPSTSILGNGHSQIEYKVNLPGPGAITSAFVPRSVDKINGPSQERTPAPEEVDSFTMGFVSGGKKEDINSHAQTGLGDRKRQRSPLTDQISPPDERLHTFHN